MPEGIKVVVRATTGLVAASATNGDIPIMRQYTPASGSGDGSQPGSTGGSRPSDPIDDLPLGEPAAHQTEATEPGLAESDEATAAREPCSLDWPPPEDELDGWEVLHLHDSGQRPAVKDASRPVVYVDPEAPRPHTGRAPVSDVRSPAAQGLTAPRLTPLTPSGSTRSGQRPAVTGAEKISEPGPLSDANLPETVIIEPTRLTAVPRPDQSTAADVSARLSMGDKPARASAAKPTASPVESMPTAPLKPADERGRDSDRIAPAPGPEAIARPETARLEAKNRADGDGSHADVDTFVHDPVVHDPVVHDSGAPTSRAEAQAPALSRGPVLRLPVPERSNPEQSNPERSNPERSNPDRSNPERSNPDRSNTESPNSERPRSERTSSERTSLDRPGSDRPGPSPAADAAPAHASLRSRKLGAVAIGLLSLAVVALTLLAYLLLRESGPAAGATATASLSVESNPAGAEVIVDGHARGRTPFQADLTPGHHQLEVKLGDVRRTIPVVLQAGLAASHYLEFARAEAPPAARESAPAAPVAIAALEVRSEPSGARVSVDGSHRGSTPLVVKELAPGEHTVRVSGPFRTVSRKVDLAAGQHGLLIVTPTEGSGPARAAESRSSNEGDGARAKASSPGRGWVTVDSPLVLRVLRNGSFIGTSEDGRLPLEAGEHTLSLENDSVNFRESRMVLVETGKGQPLRVELPQGMLSINAVPWAEVYIDNKRIGETPVAQLAMPVGVHEIRFKHPDYGERRVSALVRVGVPGRTFVDFTK